MRFFVSNILMFLLILLMLIQPVQAQAYSETVDDSLVCMENTKKFEKEYQIKKHLLSTISSVETGRWNAQKRRNIAWPWTINAQGKGMFFQTKAEAVQEVKRLQKAGVRSIDVGCMQINLAYHADAFDSVEDALDPQKNVEYGAKFLKNLYEAKGKDWLKAAMAYHSSVPRKALRYKKRLASAYEMVKQANNIDSNAKLFGNTETEKNKKNTSSYAKKDTKAEKLASANKKNRWREAILAEYRSRKAK